MAPNVEWERERERKPLDDCNTFGSKWKLIREPLGTSPLKEGADVAVGERTTGRKETPSQRKWTLQAQPPEEKNCDTPLGYSGRRAFRREQCGLFTPCESCWAAEVSERDDYATIREAVFSPCRAVPSRAAPRSLLGSASVNTFGLRNSENFDHVTCVFRALFLDYISESEFWVRQRITRK
jgi:hypothetical protein